MLNDGRIDLSILNRVPQASKVLLPAVGLKFVASGELPRGSSFEHFSFLTITGDMITQNTPIFRYKVATQTGAL